MKRLFILWVAATALVVLTTVAVAPRLHGNMVQGPSAAGPAGIARDGHGVGGSGAAGASSNTVAITNSAPGEVVTVFWLYCRNGDVSCNANSGSTPIAASGVTGTRGETCSVVSGASHFIALVAGSFNGGVGAAFCTPTTTSGSDTITVTMTGGVNYLQVWAISWSGAANTLDTACTNSAEYAVFPTASAAVSIPTAANTTIANDYLVGFVFPSAGATIAGTGGTVISDGAPGNLEQATMYLAAGAPGPYALTATVSANANWAGNVICIHP